MLSNALDIVNHTSTEIVALFFMPLRHWPRINLLFWSVVLGVVLARLFPLLSNQRALQHVAHQLHANLLAIKLFKDDLRTTLRCQVRMCILVIYRLVLWVPAMIILALPSFVLWGQFASFYEYRPLYPGESIVVEMNLGDRFAPDLDTISIIPSKNIQVQTLPMRDFDERSVYWRIAAIKKHTTQVQWKTGTTVISKRIDVLDADAGLLPVGQQRINSDLISQLLFPTESSLPDNQGINVIKMHYPRRKMQILGWALPWWVWSLVAMMASGWFVGKKKKIYF